MKLCEKIVVHRNGPIGKHVLRRNTKTIFGTKLKQVVFGIEYLKWKFPSCFVTGQRSQTKSRYHLLLKMEQENRF